MIERDLVSGNGIGQLGLGAWALMGGATARQRVRLD